MIATGWNDQVAGWDFHPLKTSAFPRRTFNGLLERFYKAYALAPGRDFKLIKPPFIPERQTYYEWVTKERHAPGDAVAPEAEKPRRAPAVIRFKCEDGCLTKLGEGPRGLPSVLLLKAILDIGAGHIEGRKDILEMPISADLVYRPDVDQETMAAEIEQALGDVLNLPVGLAFIEDERRVIVTRDKYARKPVPGVEDRYRDSV